MAYFDTVWYLNAGDQATTGHFAVLKRPQNAAVTAGQLVRQFTLPAATNERVFVCIVAGTTANTTDAAWSSFNRGTKTTDGTAQWQECTGMAAVNGDAVNTLNWTQLKVAGVPSLGVIIKRNDGASYQICTTAGTLGAAEPAFSNTAGVTTTETAGTTVWTCIGVVGNFTGGQAPMARIQQLQMTNFFSSGNTIYVGSNHAETQSAHNYTMTSALMCKILCHNAAGPYPPTAASITTGATITSSSSAHQISGVGSFYFYGISFRAAAWMHIGGASAAQNWFYFDNCDFQAAASCGVMLNYNGSNTVLGTYIFNDCRVKFAAAATGVNPYFCNFIWQNTGQVLVTGSTVPANLINFWSGGRVNTVVLRNLDLSQITTNLVSSVNPAIGSVIIQDCRLNSTATVVTPINTGLTIGLIRSDSGATGYKSTRYAYEGTETTDTVVVRTGGAADPSGQAQSRKILTTANVEWLRPFKAEPMAAWNSTVGASVTVTVYGAAAGSSLPSNTDIWLELEYLGSLSGTLGTFATTTKANVLASSTTVSGDGFSVWPGTGAGDLYFDNVKLLLGFEGADASTGAPGLTDESGVQRGIGSVVANAQIDTAQSKFSTSSLLLDGTGDYITFPDSVDWDFGTAPFTLEGWFRFAAVPTNAVLMMQWGGGFAFYFESGFLKFRPGSGSDVVYNWAPSTNVWYHIAFDRDASNAARIYVNGAMMAKATSYSVNITGSSAVFAIGSLLPAAFSGYDLNGWVEEVRVTKGIARYASDAGYTVPTARFPRSGQVTAFKLSAEIVPQLPGYVHARVRVGKPSALYYIDPKIVFAVGGAVIDTTAPTITSAATANLNEDTVLAHVLTADELVVWSIVGGADQSKFELSGSTLRWTGNGTKDFEAPDDSDVNNTYVVQVRAVDAASNGTNQTITITVLDYVPFTPAALTGLLGWWDASIYASIVFFSGVSIQTIADQSGNSRTLTWSGFGRPTYGATGFNGLPAFVFESAVVGGSFTNASFPMGTGSTLTVWYVGQLVPDAGFGAGDGRALSYAAPSVPDWNNLGSWGLSRYRFQNDRITLSRNSIASDGLGSIAALCRIILTIDSSGSPIIYFNGVPTVGTTTAGNWVSGGTFRIGGHASGNYELWNGTIAEAGVATGLADATTVAALDLYLKNKWGLS